MKNINNHIIPRIGLGTYNMNSNEAEEMSYAALDYGYRNIDTAAVYRNEDGVGRALKRIFDDTDIDRKDITITTKLWPGGLVKVDRIKNREGTIKSLDKSLRNLDLDYVDLAKLWGSSYILQEMLKNNLLFNKNLSSNITLVVENIVKNKIFNSMKLFSNFDNGKINFNNTYLVSDKIGILSLTDSTLQMLDNKLS